MSLFHRNHGTEPCPHMVSLLNRAADGSSRGWARWYALAHAARCKPCHRFLENLEALVQNLREMKDVEPNAATIDRLANGAWRNNNE